MSSARASAVILAALLLMAVRPPVSEAASDVVVGSEQKKTYDCAGGAATVEGGYNVVTFRNCATVTVKGGDNRVDAGLAETIEILGADNTITWTERADGRRPRIANKGGDNVISSRKAPAAIAPPATTPGRPAPAPSPGRIRVDQDRGKGSYDCRGASATVNGDHNELTFRNCDQLTVNGHFNTVDARAVLGVILNGGDNKLQWEEAEDGSRPKITDNGRGNTVTGKR